MKVTWFGTASVALDDGDDRLLFDPFVRMNRKLPTYITDFTGADAIFVTHGHIDHIFSIPEITELDKDVCVYCTKTPRETLIKRNVAENRINLIAPGDKISVGSFNITVHKGRHVTFDPAYIMSVLPKSAAMLPLVCRLEYLNLTMPENNEIVIYEVENNGKHVLIMGSYGVSDEAELGIEPDLFILPYGGSHSIPKISAPLLNRLRPKKILVDHFDDAFPPVTKRMNVEAYSKQVMSAFPDTEFIIPKERVGVEI